MEASFGRGEVIASDMGLIRSIPGDMVYFVLGIIYYKERWPRLETVPHTDTFRVHVVSVSTQSL